jgi:hypothetical protein
MAAALQVDAPSKTRNGVPSEVHALLVLWGNWTRTEKLPGRFPSRSPFVKAMLYGKLGIPQESNVRPEDSMPALVEWMDGIVEQMPRDLSIVIEAKYKPKLDDAGNEPNFDAMARLLCMSPSTFRSRLESAQWFVYARMYA